MQLLQQEKVCLENRIKSKKVFMFFQEPSAVISKDIWQIDEVPDKDVEIHDEVDQRPQPE